MGMDTELMTMQMTRRRFLLLGGSAALTLVLGGCLGDKTDRAAEVQAKAATPATPQAAPTTAVAQSPNPANTPAATATTVVPTPTSPARVATRCPKGFVNDPYPGHCRLYLDRNGNGICDYSET